MKKITSIKKFVTLSGLLVVSGLVLIPSISFAAASTVANTNTTPDISTTSQQEQRITNIKSKGDAEINRRLTKLNKLDSLIYAAVHLSPSDKSTLSTEVNSEISGLTALETQLNSETTLSATIADAQNIILGYRVYALITPKIWLIKTADDQQAVETKLSTLATTLQTRITTDKNAGKDVTSLQTTLISMDSQISEAQSLSSSVETDVLPLQPGDYNSDHTILSGYQTKLQTAHSDAETAYSDAKTIVNGLKSL